MPRKDNRRQARSGRCHTVRFEIGLVLTDEERARNDSFVNRLRQDVAEQKRISRLSYQGRLRQIGQAPTD